MSPPNLLTSLLLLLPALSTASYCGGDTPLSTPYFAPFQKRAEAVLGCAASSPPGSSEQAQVHVVQLTGALPEVFLHVNGTSPVSLLLMAASPTTWHLATTSPLPPSILVSVGSSVLEAASGRPIKSSPALLSSAAIAAKIARGRFGHLNTFSTVGEEANRIFVSLNDKFGSEPPCKGPSRHQSKATTAYMVERQSSFGCYHPEAAGLLPNDVHVIDLRDGQKRQRYRRSSGPLPEVVVELGPEVTESLGPLSRNLTLVLKSDQRVRWMLKSSGIQGRLLVSAGNDPVEKVDIDAGQELEVQQAAIPDQFDGLMAEVTHQYGMPLSYLRVHHANLLEMTIPPRSKRDAELANLWEDRARASETSRTSLTQAKSLDERIYAAAETIESVMVKQCDEARKEMSITLPAATLAQLGVGTITLNDATCEAEPSGDTWTVVSHSTKCGSTALIQGSVPMYRNNLNIHFRSGHLAGQKTRISFICKFRPCIPGMICTSDEEEEDEDEDTGWDEPEEEAEEMYSISVKLARGEKKKTALLEQRGDSAAVALGDLLEVSSQINAVPYLALAMEQCWLSDTARPASHARPQDTKLISSGCSAREDVKMAWAAGSSNSAFTFRVSPILLRQPKVWLQCRMGLCSATNNGASGNILRCVEPQSSCGAGAPAHEESALQQVTVRGPLHLIPVSRHALPDPVPTGDRRPQQEQEETEEDDEGTSHARPSNRTLVEVPVEVAVAISLASFLVGALSTGVLWFLHSRALRAKSDQLRSVLATTEAGTELQSMLVKPSRGGKPCPPSQPPGGQGGLPGDHNGNCPACPLVINS